MKRFFTLCLALFLCFGIIGCQGNNTDQNNLPYETETVLLDESARVTGEITEKIAPNILVLQLNLAQQISQWGKTVHIVTDQYDEWCVKDQIEVLFRKAMRPVDADGPVQIIPESINPYIAVYKPVIYLYPENATVCSVKVSIDGRLTCTYPDHGDAGWENFTAYPDGTLVFPDGKEYYALYWEGLQNTRWDFSRGFCVPGENTAEFLEWALAQQGLTLREANEFIIYWLPLMQENPYNVIAFQTNAYTDTAQLQIQPSPDSLLRVFMAYYPSDTPVSIAPQTFESFVRSGFTVVEWGGSQIEKP